MDSSCSIREVMSSPVLTVELDSSLGDAWHLMHVSGLRHLAVVDDQGSYCGLISDRQVLAHSGTTGADLDHRVVRDLVGAAPSPALPPDASPRAAAALMAAASVEAVAILDDPRHIAGIVTESDLIRWLAA